MFRLSRHLTRPSTVQRALRAQGPSGPRSALLAVFSHKYASSSTPRRPLDKYGRLLASLRPGMKEDEMAITIAALFWSTNNAVKLEMLQDELKPYIAKFNKDSLYKKVNHFLNNPPVDNFDSVLAKLPEIKEDVQEDEAKSVESTKHWTENEGASNDPSLPTPAEQLSAHLQTREVRRAMEMMEPEYLEELQEMMGRIYHENTGDEDMEVLDRIAHFLSYHGLGLKYNRRLEPIQEDRKVDYLGEYESLIGEPLERDLPKEDETPSSPGPPRLNLTSSQPDPTETEEAPPRRPYPDLMTSDPLLDSRDVLELPPSKDSPYHNRVVVRNHYPIFQEYRDLNPPDIQGNPDLSPTTTDLIDETASEEIIPRTRVKYRFPLVARRVTQQTGKGKIHRQYVLMVVGNGDGLVGLGQGKDEDAPRAQAKAYAQAVRNLDWVERFEDRTIWTDMETKLGATQIIMRPRPLGFGLQCNPNLHQVFKAAGIKDISAKVWGSRNPINVIKAVFRVLQAGHAPLAMGDGIGGPGRKLNKGRGLRSKGDVERERGRQLISLRK